MEVPDDLVNKSVREGKCSVYDPDVMDLMPTWIELRVHIQSKSVFEGLFIES